MHRRRHRGGGAASRRLVLVALGLAVSLTAAHAAEDGAGAAPDKAKVDFYAEVAPILRQHCVDCHGPVLQLGELRLDQRQYALVEGEDRGLIKPGDSANSLLIQRLVDAKLGLIMPPTFPVFPQDKVGLPERQIAILKQWIDQGAEWPAGATLTAEAQADPAGAQVKALFAAIRAGDRKAVAQLIADRSLVNAADPYGATPLMHAALYADAALMRLLLEHGADVNSADRSGATALMWGAGDLAKVRLLVERGAKVDVQSELGRTPLLVATTYVGNTDVVRFLLKSGARITDRDTFGETALTSASKRGDARLVEALIEEGADMHSGGGFVGRSPLAWAAEEGNIETIACLLKHGAAEDAKSLNGALFNAAVRGPAEAVRLLLEHGAEVNAPAGFGGYTPLMGAAYSEAAGVEIVKLLLERGADATAKGPTGDTPIGLARKRGHAEIVKLLEKAGASPDPAPSASPTKAAAPGAAREAAEKSLSLLQKCGPEFFRKSGCVACHQQSVTSLALAEARAHDFQVNEHIAREQVQVSALTIKGYRDRLLQRADHPGNSAPAAGYLLWGLAAEDYSPDEFTDALVVEMASRQTPDGSWTAFGHRPPMEHSRVTATALAIRAMQAYGPPGHKEALEGRIARGRDWLIAAKPASSADGAFRLLGLHWAGAPAELATSQAEALLAQQRKDGGWAQLDTLESDAFATGLALYALHHAGKIAASDSAYQRGVAHLLKTQLPDGSWHVKSRSFPFQPYFESGFPHGGDQWISAAATGFAAAALIASTPTAAKSKASPAGD